MKISRQIIAKNEAYRFIIVKIFKLEQIFTILKFSTSNF